MIDVGEGVGGLKKTPCLESSWSYIMWFHHGIRAAYDGFLFN